MWARIKFDDVYFIHKVIVYFRFSTDWFYPTETCTPSSDLILSHNWRDCVDRTRDVKVIVKFILDNEERVRFKCGQVGNSYGVKQSDQVYTTLCNKEGNEVRLGKGQGVLDIREVVVTGKG